MEKEYEQQLEKHRLAFSFDALINEIYQENRVNVLDFWQGLTKKGLTEKFLFDKLRLLQDIWNYFPHKHLNNLSPIEAYMKMKKV